MQVLPRLVDKLLEHYMRDHRYVEQYPGSWIDNSIHDLSYEELGVLIGEIFPLMEDCHFDLGNNFDGHNLFETVVDIIVEQLFVEYGILSKSANESGLYTIHAGKLALFKSADPEVYQSKVA